MPTLALFRVSVPDSVRPAWGHSTLQNFELSVLAKTSIVMISLRKRAINAQNGLQNQKELAWYAKNFKN